jgi:hypothetical protein
MYSITLGTLKKWEKNGELKVYDADLVDYDRVNRAGARVQWVYDQEQLDRVVKKFAEQPSLPQKTEAKILDMFSEGKSVEQVVRKTRLSKKTVESYQEWYISETESLLVPAPIMRKIRALGCRVKTPQALYSAIERLYIMNDELMDELNQCRAELYDLRESINRK